MANMPTTLPGLSTSYVGTDDAAAVDHAGMHNSIDGEVNAIAAKLGVDSSAVATSIDYLLKNASSVNPGHRHTYAGAATQNYASRGMSIGGTSGAAGASTGILGLVTGNGAQTNEALLFGIVDGSYAWIEAQKPGTAYRPIVLQPASGSVGIGAAAAPYSSRKLSVVGGSQGPDATGRSILAVTTGTGQQTDNALLFGIVDGSYAWIEAQQQGTGPLHIAINPQGFAKSVIIGGTTLGTLDGQNTLTVERTATAYHILSDFSLSSSAPYGDEASCGRFVTRLTGGQAGAYGIEVDAIRSAGAAVYTYGIGINVVSTLGGNGIDQNCGLVIYSQATGWGVGAGTRGDSAVFVRGTDGWSYGFLYRDTDDVTNLYLLTQTGSVLGAGYARVGSTSAPLNTTAGDLTVKRLNIGNVNAFGVTDMAMDSSGTTTQTAASFAGHDFQYTSAHASNSTSNVRAGRFRAYATGSTGATLTSLRGLETQTLHRQDGAVTNMIPMVIQGLVLDGSTPATAGTVTNASAIQIQMYSRNAGTSVVTATNLTGLQLQGVGDAGLTSTTQRGIRCQTHAAGTFTTMIGVDLETQNLAATSNYGIRIAYPGIADGLGAMTDCIGLVLPAVSRAMGNQTATLTSAFGISIGIPTYTSTTLVRTITNAAGLYIAGAPVASTNVTVTNGPYSLWVDADSARFDGRMLAAKGADVASANDITLGGDGNFFGISGTTTINRITTTGWTAGSVIVLKFAGSLTVTHNTAGAGALAGLLLAGAVNFSATATDTLTLIYDGTNWVELARAVI